MALHICENEEHQKKGALKQKIEASLYTLDCGFKKIQLTPDTYVLVAKILQNGTKFRYTKAGIRYSKITGIWTTSDKQWKVQKVEI